MNRIYFTLLSLAIAATLDLFLPLSAQSMEPTNAKNCHCFRDRIFNPADKFISDDYILTTTFNSLLASEFGIDKRQIIMMKMKGGVANTDLMAALFIAQGTGKDASQLLQKKKQLSWQEIVKSIPDNSTSKEQGKNLSFISSSSTDLEIEEQITQRLISSRFSPTPESLVLLREQGLDAKQIILSFTLANQATIPVEKIADLYLTKGHSWSEIAHNLGLQPADTGKLLERVPPKN